MPNCSECSDPKIYAKGKCRRCYNRSYQKKWREGYMCGQFVGAAKFATCHPQAKHYAKGRCRACYVAEFQKDKKREYDAQRYKDRKLNKTEPKVQERVTYIASPSAPRKSYPPGTFATPEDERAFRAWVAGDEDELSAIHGEM